MRERTGAVHGAAVQLEREADTGSFRDLAQPVEIVPGPVDLLGDPSVRVVLPVAEPNRADPGRGAGSEHGLGRVGRRIAEVGRRQRHRQSAFAAAGNRRGDAGRTCRGGGEPVPDEEIDAVEAEIGDRVDGLGDFAVAEQLGEQDRLHPVLPFSGGGWCGGLAHDRSGCRRRRSRHRFGAARRGGTDVGSDGASYRSAGTSAGSISRRASRRVVYRRLGGAAHGSAHQPPGAW